MSTERCFGRLGCIRVDIERKLTEDDTDTVTVVFLHLLQRFDKAAAIRTLEVGKLDERHRCRLRPRIGKPGVRQGGSERLQLIANFPLLLEPVGKLEDQPLAFQIAQVLFDLRRQLLQTSPAEPRFVLPIPGSDILLGQRRRCRRLGLDQALPC